MFLGDFRREPGGCPEADRADVASRRRDSRSAAGRSAISRPDAGDAVAAALHRVITAYPDVTFSDLLSGLWWATFLNLKRPGLQDCHYRMHVLIGLNSMTEEEAEAVFDYVLAMEGRRDAKRLRDGAEESARRADARRVGRNLLRFAEAPSAGDAR